MRCSEIRAVAVRAPVLVEELADLQGLLAELELGDLLRHRSKPPPSRVVRNAAGMQKSSRPTPPLESRAGPTLVSCDVAHPLPEVPNRYQRFAGALPELRSRVRGLFSRIVVRDADDRNGTRLAARRARTIDAARCRDEKPEV